MEPEPKNTCLLPPETHTIYEMVHFPLLIEIDEDGVFIVSCPQFKGCHTSGKKMDEVISRNKEAIQLCFELTPLNSLNTFVGFQEVGIVLDA